MFLQTPSSAALPRREVTVRLGSARPAPAASGVAPLALIGVVEEQAPWLATLLPRAVVRDTRFPGPTGAVEHLRIGASDPLDALPGLAGARSRLRDAARIALSAGAPSVDVLVARCRGSRPWQLHNPEIIALLDQFLADLPGAVLVYPDLGGPEPAGPGEPARVEERVEALIEGASRLAPGWRERFQIGLLDLPPGAEGWERIVLSRLLGLDAGLCRWRGSEAAAAAHGWRSAAAAVGAALTRDGWREGLSLEGRRLPLPPGRRTAASRAPALSQAPATAVPRSEDEDRLLVDLALAHGAPEATVQREPSLRSPDGAWTLPALRIVKAIHRLVVETASRFVFDTADDGRATALAAAVAHALSPFVDAGMLVGPDQHGPPELDGWPDADPAAPALWVELSGWLRPWSQSVSVRVSVRPGLPAELEVN